MRINTSDKLSHGQSSDTLKILPQLPCTICLISSDSESNGESRHDTRWLLHKAAVNTLLRSLSAVLVTLQNLSDLTAVGLHNMCSKYVFSHNTASE